MTKPMTEYQFLVKHEKTIKDTMYALYQAFSYGQFSILDVVACRSKMDAVTQYMELRHRLDKLKEESPIELSYDNSGFKFDGHTFESLDEIEKALKNKAFL